VRLIIAELEQLEKLLKSTSADAKDRPAMMRRLADDYAELEFAAVREGEPGRSTAEHARKAASNYYQLLITEYAGSPSKSFPTAPPPAYPKLDEVTFSLALEHRQAQDLSSCRRVLLDLVIKFPTSKYVSRTYIVFGELFTDEASSDRSKFALAEQAFAKGVTTSSGEPAVHKLALTRLVAVAKSAGHDDVAKRAQAELDGGVAFGSDGSDDPAP
jgi:hypothetical protein